MKYLELTKSIKLALISTFILEIMFLIQGQYLASGATFWAFLLILRLSTVEKALKLAEEENN